MPRSDADRGTPYFPAFLDLLGKRVVVVGGGHVATTKVRALLLGKPRPLVVIAPEASDAIQHEATAGNLVWHSRPYRPTDLDDAALAFGATDDRALNARVAADARQRGIPVLAVDDIPNCDFIAPALIRRGDLVVAISTSGRSPAMARRAREHLARALPASWGDLLEVATTARVALGSTRAAIEPSAWQAALDDVEPVVERGDLDSAVEALLRKLEQSLFEAPRGLVSLVGAGPGDPELLTLRAVRRLQAADAVVYDRLVSPAVLDYAAPNAERIPVGKAPGGHGASQQDIHSLLLRLARDGRRVVRLKGGDPFVFGRGGEEALALARAGIPFEIVPGVSSALAAPAAAGIPVTHRGVSASVTVTTGHSPDEHDWASLARMQGTLVFLMAVANLERIADELIDHGRAPNEPAALIEWASTPRQRVVTGPLNGIAAQARTQAVAAPAVLVVGPTAALSSQLADRTPVAREAAVYG
ncbi:MAG: uroporphyrinogen-III C-methyltransferase [Chloroflexi bacterium]|nr:uroporphyrinogen-III C-methyltransferase [Chloroflexota bacterium]